MIALLLAASIATTSEPRARDLGRLPEWAESVVRETRSPPPERAEARVLLQLAELEYRGEGRIRARVRRVVEVLDGAGRDEAEMTAVHFGGRVVRLRQLRAWNLRADGQLEKIERSGLALRLATEEPRLIDLQLSRVGVGSLVAFESEVEFDTPTGPLLRLDVLERRPVARFLVEARTRKDGVSVRVRARHLEPWCRSARVEAGRAELLELPPQPDEQRAPYANNVLPAIDVAFLDASLPQDTLSAESWDSVASWFHAVYASRAAMPASFAAPSLPPAAALLGIHDRLVRGFVYQQLHLTPDRSVVPLQAAEVDRRRYGDCKDLATWFMAQARMAGLKAYPVLARVVEGFIEPDEAPSPYAFNHALLAVVLPQPAGFAAEVDSERGRLLLVDATARFTPLGLLPAIHRGRRVLVCTEQGALWVSVPDAAIESERRSVRLSGEVDEAGRFVGTVASNEEGETLRATIARAGRETNVAACSRLQLPPFARCTVRDQGDPLQLGGEFRVEYEVELPNALRRESSGGWQLQLPGLPEPGDRPTRTPRRLPIQAEVGEALDWQLELRLARALRPRLRTLRSETAFGIWSWSAEASGSGPVVLRARLSHEPRAAYFGFERLEEGLAEWRREHADLRRLLEEALVLE